MADTRLNRLVEILNRSGLEPSVLHTLELIFQHLNDRPALCRVDPITIQRAESFAIFGDFQMRTVGATYPIASKYKPVSIIGDVLVSMNRMLLGERDYTIGVDTATGGSTITLHIGLSGGETIEVMVFGSIKTKE